MNDILNDMAEWPLATWFGVATILVVIMRSDAPPITYAAFAAYLALGVCAIILTVRMP